MNSKRKVRILHLTKRGIRNHRLFEVTLNPSYLIMLFTDVVKRDIDYNC